MREKNILTIQGEEFVCVLPNTGIEGVKVIGNNLRAKVEALKIPHKDSSVRDFVTISLGGSSIIPVSMDGLEDVVKDADDQLYHAKEGGRNRIYPI